MAGEFSDETGGDFQEQGKEGRGKDIARDKWMPLSSSTGEEAWFQSK